MVGSETWHRILDAIERRLATSRARRAIAGHRTGVAMPKEESIRENELRQRVAKLGFDLCRLSRPMKGKGYFVVASWKYGKIPVGGPEGTLDDIEEWLGPP